MSEAILIVDPQNDFFPGGSLEVEKADEIIDPINRLIARKQGCPVYVSQDWHPKATVHFAEQGGLWPPHCVRGTPGAEIHKGLDVDLAEIVKKGRDPEDDGGYSAFEGIGESDDSLEDLLRGWGATTLIVCGLATDYCVRATVLDAFKKGFDVQLFADGCRAVNIKPEDGIKAVADMMEAGATLLDKEDLVDM